MKFSENWLRQFANPALDSAALGHLLTMAGLEVEAREAVAPAFSHVVVAQILSAEKHPDADRLQVLRVDVGQAEPLQIVCGAANARAGLKSVCALVGAELPGFAIKRAKVRGVESFGMMCSEKELGLATQSEGIVELPDSAPVGQDIRAYFDLDDQLFELKLTPNRSDCLSVAGIARDVAALTGAALNLPQVSPAAASSQQMKTVRVDEPEACPRYCGRVIEGVNAGAATPDWMKRRLERSGVRPISAVVDITNYVLLEMGQPLHAFDLAKLSGDVRVRFARHGESIVLLNDQTVALQDDMLVIADERGAVALAGIMGGAGSAVSDGTTAIFLESAFFSPGVIAGRGRRLGLSTDSSYRFERGVDFAATRLCLERATQLIVDICGGNAGEVSEVQGELPPRAPIGLRVARAGQVLGIELAAAQIAALLARLRFDFSESDGEFRVTPPSYRFDLAIEADLIEEVARLHGYDNVPALAPKGRLEMLPRPEAARGADVLRAALAARDYQEVINYSFVDAAWERDLAGNDNPLALKNPISAQMSVMRSTLFGGLVDNLRFNLNRKQERVRLFETGRCFPDATGDLAHQPEKMAALCYGAADPEQWGEPARMVDFYDAKSDVEALLWPAAARFEAAQHPALHPGQSAKVLLDGECVGWIGALHPKWRQAYELPGAPVLFELDMAALLRGRVPAFGGISKFPLVRRDIAIVVDEKVSVQVLLDAMRKNLPEVVIELALFDVYRGKGIDSGKKSLAFRVLLQDTRQTLTDETVEAITTQLAEILTARFDAKLRN
ncbi:MAG: phenylalanine--tRNA ligase subunit beta [Sulfuricella sp.]|nr:phenylalanine--tRNA ligase subunit beta [Sulfuricella sp.]